ncbi:MAG: gliding motility-associated C-terminal domain-containing protein [Cyclobacteriaceae bacterium]|nr:gliding motility-associated C-terminal domain-containing protein [Cyclobacteriaceae bacterium]
MKKGCLIGLIFLLNVFCVHAQYTSRLGRFSVDEVKGCAPFTVTILNTNLITSGQCTPGFPCLMTPGNGGATQQNQFTLTYTQPGTYTLSILYQNIGADDIQITVDPNVQPDFEIYTCSGFQTSIKITDKTYDQYFIDFNNDGIVETAIPNSNNQTASHNYGGAGTFNISVRGRDINSANNCAAKIQSFTALPVLPTPQINTLTALNSSSLQLDFTPQPNIQYRLEIGVNSGTVFQQFQTLYGINTVTIPNLQTDNNFYCFRLSSFDPCTNTHTYSAPVCSHNFDLSIENGNNRLTWATAAVGVVSTAIRRNNTLYTTIPGSPNQLNDVDVVCKTNYCYQVINNYAGGSRSISLEKCGEAFTTVTPAAVNNVSAQVASPGVQITWQQDPAFTVDQYSILRGRTGAGFSVIAQTPVRDFADPDYTTESGNCYRINYTDLCGNTSTQGILVCPIRLSATVDTENVITVRWSGFKGWQAGVANYELKKFDKSGGLIATLNLGIDTVWVDDQPDDVNQVLQYVVTAQPMQAGLPNSVSNRLVVTREVNLFHPTAFTPDGVGPVENETFTVRGHYITRLELKVFDRWGTMVYYNNKNEPWNGTNNGRALPEGTYVWNAEILDFAGRTFKRGGSVVILKKKN